MNTPNSSARLRVHLGARATTVAALAVALSLPSASVLAAAQPSAEATDSPPVEASGTAASGTEASGTEASGATADETDPAVAESRALFERGLKAYEAGDYAGATQDWTEAHERMGETPALAESRHVLAFDLAQAHMRAYATDQQRSRLVAAKPLLDGFLAWLDRPGHTMDAGEQQDRARAVELLARIDEEESPPAPVAPAPAMEQAPPPQPLPPTEPKPDGTKLLIGGGLALGGGIASAFAAAAMFKRGSAAEDDYDEASQAVSETEFGSAENQAAAAKVDEANRAGSRANVGLLTFAVSSLVLSTAGITMLALGGRRRSRRVSASASLTPRSGGAALSVRF